MKEYRRAAGLTQADLARLAIVSRGSISHIEHGRYLPSPKFAGKVCRGLSRALGVKLSPPDLFPGLFVKVAATSAE